MSEKELSNQALITAKKFMEEMHYWETEFFSLRKKNLAEGNDDTSLRENYRNLLEGILRTYAIEDKINFGRLIDLGCTNPPTYDLKSDVLQIGAIEKNIFIINIQQTVGLETLSKITLSLKNNEWLIKKKETLDHNEKWRRSPL